MARGIQGGGGEESFRELIGWVREYRERENSSTSYAGHEKLFEAYVGAKGRLEVINHVVAIRAMTS